MESGYGGGGPGYGSWPPLISVEVKVCVLDELNPSLTGCGPLPRGTPGGVEVPRPLPLPHPALVPSNFKNLGMDPAGQSVSRRLCPLGKSFKHLTLDTDYIGVETERIQR